jgi:hypothetical protein
MSRRVEQWKLLRVTTPYYCAGAVWVCRCGVWACTQSAPILNWMRFKPADEVKASLIKSGATFEWLPFDQNNAQPELAL